MTTTATEQLPAAPDESRRSPGLRTAGLRPTRQRLALAKLLLEKEVVDREALTQLLQPRTT